MTPDDPTLDGERDGRGTDAIGPDDLPGSDHTSDFDDLTGSDQASDSDDLTGSDPAGDSDGEAIVIENLTKRYGETVALDGVSLRTRPGVHGLIGPNGSGKTTLFRVIAGLSNPTAGRIERPASSVGYSFQKPRFYPELTVRENLAVFRSLDDDPEPDAWIETLLSELRLEPAAARRAGALSGGFRKKLDLALALLTRPQFLLLDEPLADVDEYSRRKILSFFERYSDADRTIMVSSHNAAAFETLYDRVTILFDGEVRADGAPDDHGVAKYRRYYG